MSFRLIFVFFIVTLCTSTVFAQGYETDAVNYGQTSIYGSARFLGLGGANTALGGDEGNISNNPAGLGFNTKSLVSISPGINVASTSSRFLNNNINDYRLNFNFGNLSVIFSGAKNKNTGSYKGGTFGISYTRTNNFQNRFHYTGTNDLTSITDYFAESSNGYVDADFDDEDYITNIPSLAYWGYMINPVNASTYETAMEGSYSDGSAYSGFPVRQDETVTTRGKQSQWNFSYGGNFNDRFYIGASLGIPMINHNTKKIYTEIPSNDNPINNLTFTDNLKVSGTGVNLKVGFIAKATEVLRLGLSAQTPTYYWMYNEYSYGLSARFNANATDDDGNTLTTINYATVPGTFSYHLITPARVKGGISLFAGKKGFVSADVEYLNYAASSLNNNLDSYDFSYDNNSIASRLKSSFNYHLGGELRINIIRLRAGFAYISSPYKSSSVPDKNYNNTVYNVTVGAGIRKDNYYIDAAFINSMYNKSYSPYSLGNGQEPVAFIKNSNSNVTFTLGTFF